MEGLTLLFLLDMLYPILCQKSTAPAKSSPSKKKKAGVIAGIVIGCLILVLIIVGILTCIFNRRKKRKGKTRNPLWNLKDPSEEKLIHDSDPELVRSSVTKLEGHMARRDVIQMVAVTEITTSREFRVMSWNILSQCEYVKSCIQVSCG